ncbi:MAG: hypothetical protein KDD39_11795 [Bdellovibrionales bacterium]|nr:hypothetical protein [Bdellovibrionales bacterium]
MRKLGIPFSQFKKSLGQFKMKHAARFVAYEVLLALLITQIIIPPHLAFAPPPADEDKPQPPVSRVVRPEHEASVDVEVDALQQQERALSEATASAVLSDDPTTVEGALNYFLGRRSGTAQGDDTLKQIQEARDRAVGLDPMEAMVDPYSLMKQTVTVIDSEGVETVYSTLEDNANFIRPPPAYRLDRDLQIEVVDNKLVITYKTLDGKPLPKNRVYKHTFAIPGIHTVMHDKQHIHILLNNGDVKTILMAHSWLFQADMRAQGGSLLVPYVGTIPESLVNQSTYLIEQPVTLEGFDAIKHSDTSFADSGADFGDLRTGDVLVLKGGRCVGVLSYKSIADALAFHLNLLKKRHEMINGDISPVEAAMRAANQPLNMGSDGNPTVAAILDRMLRGQAPGEVLPQIQGLSEHMGAMAGDWVRNPLETRQLTSPRLNNQLAFLSAIQALTANPNERSTFDTTAGDVSPAAFAETLEAEIQDFLNRNYEPAKESRGRRFVKGCLSLARYLGVRAGLVGGAGAAAATVQSAVNGTGVLQELVALPEAIYNQIIHVLPSTYVFFDLDHKVKLFDLGFVEGPETFYIVKFAGLVLLSAGIFLALPKYVFAHWDKQVLGRELPKGNFSDASAAGLTVYYTVALRMMSRLLQSTRARVAGLLGFGDLLEAARMGITPELYKLHGGKAVGAIAIRAKLEPVAVLCQELTLQIGLQALVQKALLKKTDTLSLQTVRDALGADGFATFTKRLTMLNARIWHQLHREVAADRAPPVNGRLRELERIIWESDAGTCVTDPVAALNADEQKEYGVVLKKKGKRNRWMRMAGQNELYYRFRHGEVPDNVVREAIGWNSFQDLISMVPMAILIPPFSDMAEPDLLVAGDGNITGIVSDKFVAEGMGNAAAWASQTPHEVLVWARESAATLTSAYRAPIFDAASAVRAEVQANRPATLNESARAYNGGYMGLNFLYAFQKMGHRMSIAEVKGLKILFTVSTLIAAWGYMFQFDYAAHGLTEFQANIDFLKNLGGTAVDLWWASLVKVTAGAGLAYATYRMWWNWHNLGLRNTDGEVKQRMIRYADHISNLATEVVMMLNTEEAEERAVHTQACRRHITALVNFYEQNGVKLPVDKQDVSALEGAALADYAKVIVDIARAKPPVAMTPNGPHKTAVTWTIAGITTIVGLTAFGYAWGWAKDIKFGTTDMLWVPLIMAGVYGTGKLLDWSGRQGRARLGFKWRLDAMRRLLANSKKFDRANPRERAYVFNEVMKVRALYRHYDKNIPQSVLDMDTFNAESPQLLETAMAVYKYMLSNPPEDPTRFSQRVMGRAIRSHEARLTELPEVSTVAASNPPQNGSAPGIRPWYIRCVDAIVGAVTGN